MLSRLSFRAKLLLVLFVPFLALVVVAGAGLRERFTALRAQEQYGELAAPMRALGALSLALENESVVTAWYLGTSGTADPAARSELGTARARTDAVAAEFRRLEARFREAQVGGAALAALDATDVGLAQISQTRRSVDALESTVAQGRAYFLDVDGALLRFGERVARDLKDPRTSASVGRVLALQREQQESARAAGILVAVAAGGSRDDFGAWLSALAAQARERQRFDTAATAAESRAFSAVAVTNPPTPAALPDAFPSVPPPPRAIVEEYQRDAAALGRAVDRVDDVIATASDDRAKDAQRDVLLYGGGAVVAMLLTLALIWFVARAVLLPVRKLTDAAREMSQTQLPRLVESLRVGGDVSMIEPTRIDVSSDDEIGELARAFNDVESVTLEVAQQQSRLLRKGMADLFVNLARRNQSLIERQLELLDELERNEHDPAALDALFKLDHMATRMRRNAESLLVLSGAEQPRQWQQPVALLDVVRSAASEIADFPRVDLVGVDDQLAVSGRAVADLAHLLAELLENATSFSPPDAAVVVSGAATASGFVLAISDQGIGMPADKLLQANALLRKPPVVGLALSRALGLHVVASLAARHGITVELRAGAPLGLVALVGLPGSILEGAAGTAPPGPGVALPVVAGDEPEPLGTRRVAWRPPDEPPVEEWRAAGIAEATATMTMPEVAVVPPPASPASPTRPYAPGAAPTMPARPVPPAEPVTPVAEPAMPADEPVVEPSAEPTSDMPLADEPLPTRVPGHHLSHEPATGSEEAGAEPDPLRPYRVHELLTRHDLGKRRGRGGGDTGPEEFLFPPPPDHRPPLREDER